MGNSVVEKVAKLEKRIEELEKKVETPRVNLQEMINRLEKQIKFRETFR